MEFTGPRRFADRRDAGRHLAARLGKYAGREDVLVFALPRGGVPVAWEVADALDAPLDVFVVDKPGVPDIRGKTVIVIDDGLATGATMFAAVKALRPMGPAEIVVAVPAGAPQACHALREEADEVICGIEPEPFTAVGAWYDDFSQTSDEEVRGLLRRR